jgi:hypothetical protein
VKISYNGNNYENYFLATKKGRLAVNERLKESKGNGQNSYKFLCTKKLSEWDCLQQLTHMKTLNNGNNYENYFSATKELD